MAPRQSRGGLNGGSTCERGRAHAQVVRAAASTLRSSRDAFGARGFQAGAREGRLRKTANRYRLTGERVIGNTPWRGVLGASKTKATAERRASTFRKHGWKNVRFVYVLPVLAGALLLGKKRDG